MHARHRILDRGVQMREKPSGIEIEEVVLVSRVRRPVTGRVRRQTGEVVVGGPVVSSRVHAIGPVPEGRPEMDGALADLAVTRAGVSRAVVERIHMQLDQVMALPVVAEWTAALRVRERMTGDVGRT